MTSAWRPPTLETPRLILRAIGEADAEAIFRYAGNPKVTEFTLFETHRGLEDTLAFIRDIAFPQYAAHLGPFGICWKQDPATVLGTVGCRWATEVNKTMELGYAIAEEFWGRGLTVEAARAVIGYVFANYDVVRVQAHCMTGNVSSERVMQKLGMVFEGKLRQATFRRGKSWDMVIYSVLRSEWPTLNSTKP
jgi:[ribosomal protein S5]-alanine N-acetyltransferase